MKKYLILFLIPILLFAGSPKLRVTYFLTNYRCNSCLYMEFMTRETLLAQFSSEMKDSSILFRTINIDEPQNAHYIDDFQMEFKTVVIEKMEGDSVVSWKRLDSLWNYINQDEEFSELLSREIRAQLQ